jgi:hypothetical protein
MIENKITKTVSCRGIAALREPVPVDRLRGTEQRPGQRVYLIGGGLTMDVALQWQPVSTYQDNGCGNR